MKNTISWLAIVSIFGVLVTSVVAEKPNSSKSLQTARTTVSISERIDELVDAKLEELGEKRNPEIDDDVFVRRIYLDAIGRIPTLEETQSFVNSKSKNKRAELIDELLDSYGHISRQFNYWADVLRVLSRDNKVFGQNYIDFIKDSLEQNQPYNAFVRDLLTSEGTMLDPDAGAVGYYLRDINMPEDNMSNTVRVFLGTRLECAQCHDHPFDVWTQRDYFEMVAFTGGMKFGEKDVIRSLDRKEKKELAEFGKTEADKLARFKRKLRIINTGVFGSGTGLAKLPEGFMGSDGEEDEIITGKTMFDHQPLVDAKIPVSKQSKKRKRNKNAQQVIPGARDLGSRAAYADWVTSPDNPRFTMTIANRLWKQAMGLGLIEPVDVMDDATEASNEPLMQFLTETMVSLDFDRKAFLKAIYNTRTYQSQASREDIKEAATYGFNGPLLRRMTAEQLWDSLMTLTLPDVDRRSDSSKGKYYRINNELVDAVMENDDLSAEDIIELINLQGKEGRGQMKEEMEGERQQARRKKAEVVKESKDKITQARKSGNKRLVKRLMIERAELLSAMKAKAKYSNFKRASELSSPAPAGHFLREFGQSDREQIENANSEPAVTQVLSMMNGFIDKSIARDQNTLLMANVLKANKSDVIDVIYMTMLSRQPSGQERKMWAADFNKDSKLAYNDLIWMLANSNEFIFVK